jgi:hypothetical protein
MSAVTAVIVTTSVVEQLKETETYPAIEFINHRVREFASSGEFVEVSRWARGKHPESLIFIAGLNFCNLGLLRSVFESAPWRSPDRVQIITRAGQAERFEFALCEFPR